MTVDPATYTAREIEAHVRGAVLDFLGLPTAGWEPADYAESLLGIKEEGGENRGPPDALYNLGLGDASAWCALAVMAWFICAGQPLHVVRSDWWRWRSAAALQAGLEKYRIPEPMGAARNDIAFTARNGGSGRHALLIARNLGSQVVTIEGNIGDATVMQMRSIEELDGVYRPWKAGG